jgi:hypothetical protein
MTTFFSADFEEIATDETPTNDAFRSSNTFRRKKIIKQRLRKQLFSTPRRKKNRVANGFKDCVF